MMKSRKQESGSELADNVAFKSAIKELNKGVTEWGEYWPTVFTKCKSTINHCAAPGLIFRKSQALSPGKSP
jgi:hypothetical protein